MNIRSFVKFFCSLLAIRICLYSLELIGHVPSSVDQTADQNFTAINKTLYSVPCQQLNRILKIIETEWK